jgi:hypothetical protein
MAGPSKRVKFGDEDYEKTLLQWAEEEAELTGDFSDVDSDADFIPNDHESESEIETVSEDEPEDNLVSVTDTDSSEQKSTEYSSNKNYFYN